MKSDALKTLKSVFQYDDFRPDQWEALEELKKGRDVFLVKPTGGGKSLIYQFLAAEKNRVIVLSPLIALMEDQVLNARKYGIKAECMHSQMSASKRASARKKWVKGDCELLFVTPERFFKQDFRDSLKDHKPSYFVVDEAHCAAQWGHDFRPDYSKLSEIKGFLGHPPTFACTATATEETVKEVIQTVSLQKDCLVLKDKVKRPNLSHDQRDCFDFDEKLQSLMSLPLLEGPTLIYFSLIQSLKKVSERLEALGFSVTEYHSKLPPRIREQNQKDFLADEVDFMLATPAFGLGVDKPNIRNLINFELPGSIESYVQEFGRAGRDGEPSRCFLLFTQEDVSQQMDFIKWGHPGAEVIRWVYNRVTERKEMGFPEHEVMELKKKMNFYNTYDFRIEAALNILTRWDCLYKKDRLYFKGASSVEEVPDVATDLSKRLVQHQQVKLSKLLELVRIQDEEEFDHYLEDYFQSPPEDELENYE